MQPNTGMHKLRFASCSVLLLLLTLALVASSLLVARYAVQQASSWWLSLLAVTVCLLGLCTWIQLAASRAGRWRVLLARQIALSRAQASARTLHRPGLGPGLAPDFYNSYGGSRSSSTGMGIAHIAVIPLECELDSHMGYRVPGPPPPPPYALTDLPPSYCVSTTDESRPTDGAGGASASPPAPAPPPPPGPTGLEQPPPYAVAIKRDHLVQEAAGATPPSPAVTAAEGDSTAGAGDDRRSTPVSRRPVLWF